MWSEGVPGVAAEWECDSGEQTLQALHALEEPVSYTHLTLPTTPYV